MRWITVRVVHEDMKCIILITDNDLSDERMVLMGLVGLPVPVA